MSRKPKTIGIIPCSDVTENEFDKILKATIGFTDRYIAVVNSSDLNYRTAIENHLKEAGADVISFGAALGKAEAVRIGVREALSDPASHHLYQVDGHLKQSPNSVQDLLKKLQLGAELATYSRYGNLDRCCDHRITLVTLMADIVQRLTDIDCTDTVCGTRAYTRFFAEQFLKGSQAISYGLEIEQILFAGRSGAVMSEIHVKSKRQADNTAAEKLVANFLAVLYGMPDELSNAMTTELQSLVTALGQFKEFELDASLWSDTLDRVKFAPVHNGEDGDRSYRLSSS